MQQLTQETEDAIKSQEAVEVNTAAGARVRLLRTVRLYHTHTYVEPPIPVPPPYCKRPKRERKTPPGPTGEERG
jgi:hypothetical protein